MTGLLAIQICILGEYLSVLSWWFDPCPAFFCVVHSPFNKAYNLLHDEGWTER